MVNIFLLFICRFTTSPRQLYSWRAATGEVTPVILECAVCCEEDSRRACVCFRTQEYNQPESSLVCWYTMGNIVHCKYSN